MKAKIAKQEGDGRKAKKLNEQLDKQIRMLEKALRNERARSSGNKTGTENGNGTAASDSVKNGVLGDKGSNAVKGKSYTVAYESFALKKSFNYRFLLLCW